MSYDAFDYRTQTEQLISDRELLLNDAAQIITGDRNVDYGDPNADFARTAGFWRLYLEGRASASGIGYPILRPHDVAVMMMLLKVSRLAWSPGKRDSWLDIAGYAGCGWDCVVNDETIPKTT
jgi:hypothetical protein